MTITIRRATRDDAETLIKLMGQLAQYEKMEDSFSPSTSSIREYLQNTDISRQGTQPTWDHRFLHAWLAESDSGSALGFAMGFYGGFSSFASCWEFCLHDLFVHPSVRRTGLARQFFQHMANEVCEYTNTISFEVLDWNKNAIALYERLGAYHYGRRTERDGTTWIPMKIQGEAFWALQKARVKAIQTERV